jgi:hydroxyacylglutathione hydrolase
MLLKYFYDKALAHASYMVGCQRSGEAIIFDPARSIYQYLAAADAEGLRIVGAAETHIHADFVSGSRELAHRAGATLYLSDEGTPDWKYLYAGQHSTRLLKNGEIFHIGKVKFEVMHTPGHTPESISFILTDEGGGANEPMGIFTGDFVFVGSIGRPDLLETAAGIVGSAEAGARQLYHSTCRFRELPRHMQVWPAHGAGSACGKGLGAIPSTTVGYEVLFNPALQYKDEQKFVDYILSDQPETPFYFAEMKRINKVGPELIQTLPEVALLDPAKALQIAREYLLIDTSASGDFANAHLPGSINIPATTLVQWAGFFVDYHQPLYLITGSDQLAENLRQLRSIGIDNVAGYFESAAIRGAGLSTESYLSETPEQLRSKIESGGVKLLDVRAATEFREGHIAGAEHRFLGTLLRTAGDLDRGQPVATQCLGGARSAIAASILQRAGLQVTNMQGGYKAWLEAGFPVVQSP